MKTIEHKFNLRRTCEKCHSTNVEERESYSKGNTQKVFSVVFFVLFLIFAMPYIVALLRGNFDVENTGYWGLVVISSSFLFISDLFFLSTSKIQRELCVICKDCGHKTKNTDYSFVYDEETNLV